MRLWPELPLFSGISLYFQVTNQAQSQPVFSCRRLESLRIPVLQRSLHVGILETLRITPESQKRQRAVAMLIEVGVNPHVAIPTRVQPLQQRPGIGCATIDGKVTGTFELRRRHIDLDTLRYAGPPPH